MWVTSYLLNKLRLLYAVRMISFPSRCWFTKIIAFFLLPIPLMVTSGGIEETFVKELGNDPNELVRWSIAQDDPVDEAFLKAYCAKIHETCFGYLKHSFVAPDSDQVDVAVFESVLRFRNEEYKPMKVTIIKYSFDGLTEPDSQRRYHYLTGGNGARCEFFVKPSASEGEESFYLDDSLDESTPVRTIAADNVVIQQFGTPSMTPQDAEDTFVKEFGNDSTELVKWSTVQEDPVDTEFLKINCIETQRRLFESYDLSFEVSSDEVNVAVSESVLRFHNEMYKPMKVTVVKYSLDRPMRPGEQRTFHYLTGGDHSDCVFYIKPSQTDEGSDFYIDDHPVCGSKLFRRSDTEDTVRGSDPREQTDEKCL